MQTIKTKTIELPTFEQLTEKEQSKVLDNYRDINTNYDWSNGHFDYYLEGIKASIYIYFDIKESDITFSGFYSQGDGLSFTDADINWQAYIKDNVSKFPLLNDALNHKLIAKFLKTNLSIKFNKASYRNNYVHEKTVFLEIELDFQGFYNIEKILGAEIELLQESLEAMRLDICIDLYKALENTYDDLQSDENVKETLIANEYTFNRETLEIDN